MASHHFKGRQPVLWSLWLLVFMQYLIWNAVDLTFFAHHFTKFYWKPGSFRDRFAKTIRLIIKGLKANVKRSPQESRSVMEITQ